MVRFLLILVLSMTGLTASGSSSSATQSEGYSLKVDFYLVSKSEWLRDFQTGRYDFSALEKMRSITSGDKYHLLAHIFDEPAALNFACVVEVEYVAGETLAIGKHGDEFCYQGLGNSAPTAPRVEKYGIGANGASLSVNIDDLQFDFSRPIEFVDGAVKQ